MMMRQFTPSCVMPTPRPPADLVFQDPADVVLSPDLTPGEKLHMLSMWEASLRELLGACGRDPLNHRPGHLGFMHARVIQGLAALRRVRN